MGRDPVPWVYLDPKVYNPPRLGIDADQTAIKIYYSWYIVPEAVRGCQHMTGRYLVQFRYPGDDEALASTPTPFATIFCGSKTGRVWEMDIDMGKIRQSLYQQRNSGHGAPSITMNEALRNVATACVKSLKSRRGYRHKHYDLLMKILSEQGKVFNDASGKV